MSGFLGACPAEERLDGGHRGGQRGELPVSGPDGKTSESKGVIIVAIIVCILLVAVLGSVIYFLHKKGKISCGRAGKQDM